MNTIAVQVSSIPSPEVGQFYKGGFSGNFYQLIKIKQEYGLVNLVTGVIKGYLYASPKECIDDGNYILIQNPLTITPENK